MHQNNSPSSGLSDDFATAPFTPAPRYTLARIGQELREVVMGEKGFIFTALNLFLQPGLSLQRILSGDRQRFNDPIKFLFLCVTFAAISMSVVGARAFSPESRQQFDFLVQADRSVSGPVKQLEDFLQQSEADSEVTFRAKRALTELRRSRLEWLLDGFMQWINFALLLAVPIYALFTFAIFPRQFNLAEHLVINSYIYGVQCLLAAILSAIAVWDYNWYTVSYIVLSQLYQIWAWKQIYVFQTFFDWIRCGALVFLSLVAYFVLLTVLMFSAFVWAFAVGG